MLQRHAIFFALSKHSCFRLGCCGNKNIRILCRSRLYLCIHDEDEDDAVKYVL